MYCRGFNPFPADSVYYPGYDTCFFSNMTWVSGGDAAKSKAYCDNLYKMQIYQQQYGRSYMQSWCDSTYGFCPYFSGNRYWLYGDMGPDESGEDFHTMAPEGCELESKTEYKTEDTVPYYRKCGRLVECKEPENNTDWVCGEWMKY